MIVNPNGIVVGKDGAVSASGFTASSYGISDADFVAGKNKFDRNGTTAGVRIDGKINTTSGGYVALIGAEVTNNGQIASPQGTVVMAAGESVTVPSEIAQNLTAANDTEKKVAVPLSNRVRLTVSAASINTAVSNTGEGVIVTEGGQVLLQAAAVSDAVASVTHSGRIDVSGEKGGTVTLQADSGRIKVSGSVKANSTDTKVAGGNIIIGRDEQSGKLAANTDVSGAKLEARGGFVETSGDYLKSEGVSVLAKTWLLDPVNVEINATSTAVVAGHSVVLASDINAALNNGTDVEISTGVTTGSTASVTTSAPPAITATAGVQNNGHLYVNENIAKTAGGDATLKLVANRNIDVAAGKTITSTTNKLNVILNANSGGSSGAIFFDSGSGITSNGGNITLGGGAAQNGTGFAVSDGISSLQGIILSNTQIHAGGGNIVMNGQTSVTTSQDNVGNVVGLLVSGTSAISTTGAGTIALSGKNQIGPMTRANAFELTSGSTITGGSTGAVTIVGDSSTANTGYSNVRGVFINGTVTSTGGNINISGMGGTGAQYNHGIEIGGNVIGVGAAEISMIGTAGNGSVGGNQGVSIVDPAKITSVDGNISINGTGGLGSGAIIRNHGVSIDSTKAIQSTGIGSIAVTGKVTNVDNGYSQGVQINRGGLQTTSGNIKIDGAVAASYQTAIWLNAPIKTTAGGNIYVRSAGGNIANTSVGALSANNVSIDNSNGTIDAVTGAINKGLAGASTFPNVISPNGIDITGSVTATNNVNVYGNHTGTDIGVNISGSTVTVKGKNVTINGNSKSGNGVKLTDATITGAYIDSTGSTTSGYNGFAWNGGSISTSGTGGTSTASSIKGISAASSTASNGYGALMLYGTSATASAIAGTTLTLEGNATTLASGLNTQERGILVQGGRTLNTSGNITLKGTSNNGEGISFGGTINEIGTDSQLTIIGVASASQNAGLNAVNISGTIQGNTSTGPITILGKAANTAGTNYDTAVNISGTINGGSASNVIVQATEGKIAVSGNISGNEISIDNTNGTINTSTGAITAGTGVSKYDNAISISGNLTSKDNVNIHDRR